MVNNLTHTILRRFDELGIPRPKEAERLAAYLDILGHWNKTVNLTSLQLDPISTEAIDRLIVEPVLAAPLGDPGRPVCDIGTGGGSPALPFALEVGASLLTMIESRSRKCAFLREAGRVLGVTTNVVEARFEDAVNVRSIQGSAETATIRAVKLDGDVVRLLKHLLKPGGRIIRFISPGDEQLPDGLVVRSAKPLLLGRKSLIQLISIS